MIARRQEMEWIFDEESGVLIIRGQGPMPDYGRFLIDHSPWRFVKVRYAKIEEGITSIGANAFYSLRTLEYVDIPDSVTPTRGLRRCSRPCRLRRPS